MANENVDRVHFGCKLLRHTIAVAIVGLTFRSRLQPRQVDVMADGRQRNRDLRCQPGCGVWGWPPIAQTNQAVMMMALQSFVGRDGCTRKMSML